MRRPLKLLRGRRSLSKPVSRRAKALAVAVVLTVVGFGAGAAYAVWQSPSGSGVGAAKGYTVQAVHVLATVGSPTNTLVPGQSGDLRITLNNPNPFSVVISAIASNGNGPDPGGGCTWANGGVSLSSSPTLPVTVVQGNSVTVTITNGASMALGSNTTCQGKTFQIPVTLTVHP